MRILLLSGLLLSLCANASYRVHLKKNADSTEVLSLAPSSKKKAKLLRSIPYFIAEREKTSDATYEEWIMDDQQVQKLDLSKAKLFSASSSIEKFKNSELRVLVQQGPKENRVNLTILGDGYTANEKEKFFADADRAVQGLFGDSTFKSYLPLFNVYAVFVASNQSGIGDGTPVDTAFKLYRNPKGSKRAIYPGNEAALEEALQLAPATDYPIVIANDEYYGGLGGRYAITTSSVLSGQVVLRHELGHNFGEVGEEYDNGMAYFGANNSGSANISWPHWVQGATKINESKLVSGNYVWKNLAGGKYQSKFSTDTFAGGYLFGIISSVGWDSPNDVIAKINDRVLSLEGSFNKDRNFYEIKPVQNFPKGQHTFTVEENIKDGNNVLGFAELHVAPPDYDFTPHKVAAYATFSESGRKTYRPTHASCLMRDMSVNYFCSVDKENIWHKLLARVRLIDRLEVINLNGLRKVSLSVIPLPNLQINWLIYNKNKWTELEEMKNKTEWTTSDMNSKIQAKVTFRTDEVRKYTNAFQDSN